MKTIRILILIFLLTPASHAEERVEFYTGVRQMGMGGVAVPTVADETAPLSNPAGLGRIRGAYLTLADPELTSNASSYGMGTAGMDPEKALSHLIDNPDDIIHGKGQLFPSFVAKHFGLGFFYKTEFTSYIDEDDDENETFNYFYTNDVGLVLSMSFSLWEGRIRIGASGRAINRTEVRYTDEDHETTDTNVEADTESIKIADYAREGVGIAGDAGIILTGPWSWLPSIAATYKDIGNTKFNQNDGFFLTTERRPKNVWSSLDVGASITPLLANHVRLTIAGEYRDVLRTYADSMKRVHAGIELNMYDALFFRGGMNQRYWTAGMEIAIGALQLQAASYGEEIGTADAPREDRRYVGKLAIRF